MAVRPRIGPSGGERASGSVEYLTGISVVRWTARSTLVVAAAFAILLGVADVVAIRSGEYPRAPRGSLNFKSVLRPPPLPPPAIGRFAHRGAYLLWKNLSINSFRVIYLKFGVIYLNFEFYL